MCPAQAKVKQRAPTAPVTTVHVFCLRVVLLETVTTEAQGLWSDIFAIDAATVPPCNVDAIFATGESGLGFELLKLFLRKEDSPVCVAHDASVL
eukprot:CAMPEP_0175865256 /NCGR_PEP_ID=MMETSP0107_2-20121207/33547_1 /TAXON_ID=195067 ORGANISM="Goniomonas pacifica, Strain CCMP1869" /NCGR_SAMPLE_ID=MMETSP0107_2 /ASSEMBLY_ACC=CAM_ASM_000203 /LENGTH=93 /DNA_ID=CAMNT_0017182641 /DNA_START=475 /DNA_END=757 /DNA_ORIENTATION=-